MRITKNFFFSFIFLFVFLTFLKVDFRFTDNIYCCSDDFDYYMHAETISQDFDFDYSNQLKGLETKRFNKNNKPAPIGYVGTGILAAPFMFIGGLIDKFLSSSGIMNYKFLIYSISPIFYLSASYILLIKSLNILNLKFDNLKFLIFFLGSGVTYYAFERFSMTHSYEFFTTSLLIYSCAKYYEKSNLNNKYAMLIPIAIFFGLATRWTNYFLLIIPIILKLILKSEKKLIVNPYFVLTSVASLSTFLYLSYAIYGVISLDPRTSYQVSSSVVEIAQIQVNKNIYIEYFDRIINIFVTKEFGIIYFMPILAFTVFITIFLIFKNILTKNKFDKAGLYYLIACFQPLLIVAIWRSTGSAYGFRYLLTLYPLSIIFYFYLKKRYGFFFIDKVIIIFSILSILSLLFFETTPDTQLSLERIYNSFGKYTRYTQPNYLLGLFKSFIIFDSYLKIFTTSFFGAICFKFLIVVFGKNNLVDLLGNFGLPTSNPDFIIYLENLELISADKFIFLILFGLSIYIYMLKKLVKNN